MVKATVLVPYPIEGPSSRYRIFQYIQPLEKLGIKLSVHSVMTEQVYTNRVNGKKNEIADVISLSWKMLERTAKILSSSDTTTIVQREMSPVLRGPMHQFLANVVRGPLVYDFDDAVFTEYEIAAIVRRASVVTPGNEYLADYARGVNPNALTQVIPTVVDTEKYVPTTVSKKNLVVGWIGTESTYRRYLAPRLELFARLAARYGATLDVIGPRVIVADVVSKGANFVEWCLEFRRRTCPGSMWV